MKLPDAAVVARFILYLLGFCVFTVKSFRLFHLPGNGTRSCFTSGDFCLFFSDFLLDQSAVFSTMPGYGLMFSCCCRLLADLLEARL
jgi:hypothetical protein